MVTLEEWGEIRRLHFAEGMDIKTVARQLGCRVTRCVRVSRRATSVRRGARQHRRREQHMRGPASPAAGPACRSASGIDLMEYFACLEAKLTPAGMREVS